MTQQGKPPRSNRRLAIGLFVDAEIEGRHFDDLIEIPRSALRGESQVVVVDDASRMRLRTVELLRAGREKVWIRRGLSAGERVVTTNLDVVVDGMAVRVVDADGRPVAARPGGLARSASRKAREASP